MSLASRDSPTEPIQNSPFASRLVRAAQRLVAGNSERTIVLSVLVAFIAVWMLFWTVSTASVDIYTDADEAIVWARLFALLLIPLYNAKAEVLNANTVMIPFWAATLLFYLRARRGLGMSDAFFAGAFASFTVLGKYWAVFLLAGMAVASMIGPRTRRFWRSPAPYVMAAGAALVIAPHVWWLMNDRVSIQFAESVIIHTSFGAALNRSAYYILGAVAYIAGPLIFLAALRPSRVAFADIAWPAEDARRQALVL